MSLLKYIDVKNDKNINVLILSEVCKSNKSGMYTTAKKIYDRALKRNITCHPILINSGIYISSNDLNKPNIIIRNYNNNQIIDLDPKNTVALLRGSILKTEIGKSVINYLKFKGVFLINDIEAMNVCSNKYTTIITLRNNNIPTPKTTLISKSDNINNCLKEIGNTFPVVVKLLRGSGGAGVCKVDSVDSFRGVTQALLKNNSEVLVQEYLKADFDVRTIVINGKIFGAMRRNKISGDFRSNYSLGSTVEKYNLSELERKMVLECAKITGCYICGVDHMIVDGKPYVLEVNSSPGSEGIEKATRKSFVDAILDTVSDKTNWPKVNNDKIGWIEYIGIQDLDIQLKAKADTGNGAYNVIDADDIKMNPDYTVSFTIDGKSIKKDIIDILKISIGGHRDEFSERPLVKLDINWNGNIYKDELFTLDRRKPPRQPVLLCRDFLKRVGAVIDPSSVFTLEQKNFSSFKKMFD